MLSRIAMVSCEIVKSDADYLWLRSGIINTTVIKYSGIKEFSKNIVAVNPTFGKFLDINDVVMHGRFHLYEGLFNLTSLGNFISEG